MEENEQNEQTPEVKNPAILLGRRLQENRKSLHIARIPEKTKEGFIALAEKEFCGDYGMALKWLLDDIPSQDTRMIIVKLEEQEARLLALESATSQKEEASEDNSLRMLNGRIIKRRSNKSE